MKKASGQSTLGWETGVELDVFVARRSKSRARLLSDGGELSLDGRGLLYWLRSSPIERERSPQPIAAAIRFMSEIGKRPDAKLHPSVESRRDELIAACRELTGAVP